MIVVYDVTSGESFVNVKRWLQEIDQNCDTVNRILGQLACHVIAGLDWGKGLSSRYLGANNPLFWRLGMDMTYSFTAIHIINMI